VLLAFFLQRGATGFKLARVAVMMVSIWRWLSLERGSALLPMAFYSSSFPMAGVLVQL